MSDKPPTYGLSAVDDPEIIQHLGRIAASWATLDTILVEMLCRLLRDDPAGEVIYYSLNNFRARLDIITNVVDELMDLEDPRREMLLGYLGQIDRLSRKRNELIHSSMFDLADGTAYRLVRRPGRKNPKRRDRVRVRDLEEHGQSLSQVSMEILLLINPQVLAGFLKGAYEAGLWEDDSPEPSPEMLQQLLRDSRPLRPMARSKANKATAPL